MSLYNAGIIYKLDVYCKECDIEQSIPFQLRLDMEQPEVDVIVEQLIEEHMHCDCPDEGHFIETSTYPIGRGTPRGH